MLNANRAIEAYRSATRLRSPRDQEAEVFHQTISVLRGARAAGPIQQVRALADNRRLWTTIIDLMRDPSNALPDSLRAAIVSVGITVQREMDQEEPNFDFLIAINEHMAAGLSGQP